MTSPSTRLRPRRTVTAAVTAAIVLMLAGCGAETESAPADEAAPASGSVTLPVSEVTTTLLEPGAEPRAVRTISPSGDEQSATLTAEATIAQRIDAAEPQDFSTPPLTLPLTATTSDSADGADGADGADSVQVEMVLGALNTPDATLQAALAPTEGSTAGVTLSPAGAVTALTIDPAEDARDIARSAVEQALSQAVYRAVPFPAEPIGIGARWTITQEVVSGITLTQTTTATLAAVDDGVATLDVTVEQTPNEPVWQLPDDQGTLNIESFVMRGGGQLIVDPSLPLPIGGTVNVGGDQVYRDPNGSAVLQQTTNNTVTWS